MAGPTTAHGCVCFAMRDAGWGEKSARGGVAPPHSCPNTIRQLIRLLPWREYRPAFFAQPDPASFAEFAAWLLRKSALWWFVHLPDESHASRNRFAPTRRLAVLFSAWPERLRRVLHSDWRGPNRDRHRGLWNRYLWI